jgi:hypothetical protein
MSKMVINKMTGERVVVTVVAAIYNFEVKKNVNMDAIILIEKTVFCFLNLVGHVHLQM